jgi:thiamine-phosphate pyrophosphorylase
VSVHVLVGDLDEAERAVRAGATVLRLSSAPGGTLVLRGRGLRRLGTIFYVLDDVEAARELGADGVHLDRHPERREPARAVGLRVGASIADAEAALAAGADYLEVVCSAAQAADRGAYRRWLDELALIGAAVSVPVIASGAIDSANAAACIAAGAAGVAVTGPPSDRTLRRTVDGALAVRTEPGSAGARRAQR